MVRMKVGDGEVHGEPGWRGQVPGADRGEAVRAGQRLGECPAESRGRKRLLGEALVGRVWRLAPGTDRGRERRDQGSLRLCLRRLAAFIGQASSRASIA